MIGLNLLSPAQKAALKSRVVYAMIERVMIAFVAAMLTASIALLGVRIKLTQELSDVLGRQILSTEYVTVNKEIKRLNQLISRVEAVQKQFVSPSALIVDAARRTPPGVLVTGFDADLRTRLLRVSGIAGTRDDLLAYEAALRESPYVEKLDSPISNLFQKRAINFQFQIILDVEELRLAHEPKP